MNSIVHRRHRLATRTLLLAAVLCAMLLLTSHQTAYAESDSIHMILNGQPLVSDVAPQIVSGRMLVPIRVIANALGQSVAWDNATQTVTIGGPSGIILQVGNQAAMAKGSSVTLDVPPLIIDGRTMVPLRFVAQALGYDVKWDDSTRTVRITDYGIATNVLVDPDYSAAGLIFKVALTPDGFTDVSGTVPAILGWDGIQFTADGKTWAHVFVTGGQFDAKLRLTGPADYTVRAIATLKDQSSASALSFGVSLPSAVDPHLAAGGGLLVDAAEPYVRGVTVTPSVTPEGYLALDGTVDPSIAQDQVVIQSFGPPDIRVPVKLINGSFHTVIPIPGPLDFRFFIFTADPNNPSAGIGRAFITGRQTATSNLRPITPFGDKINLDTPSISGKSFTDTVTVSGTVNDPNAAAVVATIRQKSASGEDSVAYYQFPVTNGRFTGTVWLRFGAGKYTITLGHPTSNKTWQNDLSFEATNLSGKDVRYLAPSYGIESDAPPISQLAKQLTQGTSDTMRQVRAIHDWVAQHVAYDVAKATGKSYTWGDGAVRTLALRTGICGDYAQLTIALLRAAGIQSREVFGKANGYDGWDYHDWVEALVDGRWVTVDPTFDAGYVTKAGQFVFQFKTKYFDPDPAVFAQDHQFISYIY
ncbi:MAG: stalk domain-containing protein [Mycobacterium leprae]